VSDGTVLTGLLRSRLGACGAAAGGGGVTAGLSAGLAGGGGCVAGLGDEEHAQSTQGSRTAAKTGHFILVIPVKGFILKTPIVKMLL
jgi:hypothetical protein